jgi:transcriptional regulator with XRE-family HTH domain
LIKLAIAKGVSEKKLEKDPFMLIRKQINQSISEQYATVERFAFENDLSKSTLSRFLNGARKEYSVLTLAKIANALGKKLILKLDQ